MSNPMDTYHRSLEARREHALNRAKGALSAMEEIVRNERKAVDAGAPYGLHGASCFAQYTEAVAMHRALSDQLADFLACKELQEADHA